MSGTKLESKGNKSEATSSAKQYIGDAFIELIKFLRKHPEELANGKFKEKLALSHLRGQL
ncbi:MAG: hypothetical protein ACRCXC_09490 [Legionella sp.]